MLNDGLAAINVEVLEALDPLVHVPVSEEVHVRGRLHQILVLDDVLPLKHGAALV